MGPSNLTSLPHGGLAEHAARTDPEVNRPSPEASPSDLTNVLLLHQRLLFYRVAVYNKLAAFLQQRGFRLHVWHTDVAPETETIAFETINRPMTLRTYRAILSERDVSIVVNFLNRRAIGLPFYLLSLLYGKITRRPTVYYGHGLNLNRKNNPLERIFSNLLHLLFDRIILFSPHEKRYLWKVNRKKVSIAFNTLDVEGRDALITASREELKKKHGCTEDFLVIFSGRIEPRKRLDLLVDAFLHDFDNRHDIGLVIVGPDMPEEMRAAIAGRSNIHYLGPLYERQTMAELFHVSDVFCIPGHLGLGIVEAIYWGLPVLTLTDDHAPEYYYLRHGANSLTLKTKDELVSALTTLLNERDRLHRLSQDARKTYEEQATLSQMFQGYHEALRSLR